MDLPRVRAPGTGHLIALGQDGNIAGDCDGDTVPADYDGHIEFALGGGWLSAESGDGATTGSIWCFGEVAHHSAFPSVTVNDVVFGTTIAFTIAADTVSIVPPTGTENCGDFESDESTFCISSPCAATFPPGLDGTYQVYVGDAETGSVGTAGGICDDVPLPDLVCGHPACWICASHGSRDRLQPRE